MDNKIIKIIEKKEKIKIVNEEDIEAIKDIFIGPVKDVIRIAKEKNEEVETIFKAVIPQEFIEAIKNGDFKLMESKGGEILPNIVNHKNKIVKQVRLEEVKQKLDDKKVDKLGEYALEQKLDAIREQIEEVVCLLEDIEKGQRNNRYANIDGAIMDIKQSLLIENDNYREILQANAHSKLNYALDSIYKSFNEEITFFKEWENRGFIEKNLRPSKYSTKNIKRVFYGLCKDYLYIKKAKNVLIELQLSLGIKECEIHSLLNEFYKEDKRIEETNIKSWLPPRNNNNEWQHKILNMSNYDNKIVIEYNITELLKEEEENGV